MSIAKRIALEQKNSHMNNIAEHKKRLYTSQDEEWISKVAKEIKQSIYPPQYHIYPKTGLMNDPNGLAYFNNEYHVFFQWYPFAPVHGLKNWGHTKSKDLKHWSDQEMALIPQQEFDKDGCYSGNALEHDGKLYLFYTGNYKTENGKKPKQCLAIMNKNGHIEKWNRPIIEDEHELFSGELRDPFVFEENGFYYMLLGGGKFHTSKGLGFGDEGILLLYKSSNLTDWEYQGLIDIPIDTGYMLECPSLVRIQDKDILFLSVMGAKVDDPTLNNCFLSMVAVGKLDIENMKFDVEQYNRADDGFDFYAPQTFYGKDNLPLMYAWVGCGEQVYPENEKWKHGLTYPQELSFTQDKFKRFPMKEILDIFPVRNKIKSKETNILDRSYRIHITNGFQFRIGEEHDYWEFSYHKETKIAKLSRKELKKEIDIERGLYRETIIENLEEVDVFVDHSFIEIYLNKGEKVFTFVEFQAGYKNLYSQCDDLNGYLFLEK
ncbi:MAG: glycoside hydrolase family 32 protein [Coprobacillus sp.]